MLNVRYSTKFKKDFKLCQIRGLDISLFNIAVDVLRIPEKVDEKDYEIKLTGSNLVFGIGFSLAQL